MSGMGNRFIQAGHKEPKYLINVDGKTVIEHIIDLYPKNSEFIFICNSDHAKNTDIISLLKGIPHKKKIVVIQPHKTGPVGAISQCYDLIGDEEQVIVNYCDFSMGWDYDDFEKHINETNRASAIVCYRGFHPHMLGDDNYAFVKIDSNNVLLDIKEKEPFTEDKMSEFASTGTYYFRKGKYIKKYFKELIDKDINVNNEYYVSLVHNLLCRDGLETIVYEVPYMLQWGTPLDLKIYNKWSSYFKKIMEPREELSILNAITIFPMAGKGSRFFSEGYDTPKPLINVNEEFMFLQAMKCLPKTDKTIFGCLRNHIDQHDFKKHLSDSSLNSEIVTIEDVLPGQACTCERILENVDEDVSILVSACDNGALWDTNEFARLLEDDANDIIVWSYKNNPASYYNPNMYSWLDIDNKGYVKKVFVKDFFGDDPFLHFAIVGTMFFKKKSYFIDSLKKLYQNNVTTNNEFYVDNLLNEAIDSGLKVKNFEIEEYICWGTPNDLKTYEYWQSFFEECSWHPYEYKNDFFTRSLE